MKKVITLGCIIILLFELTGLSQTHVYGVRVKGSKLWGYADLEGEVFIEPAFKLGFEFSENGRALVVPKKGFELIDLQGKVTDVEVEKLKVITDPWSGIPEGYTDGLLCIKQNNKWGALDSDGKLVIPAKYDNLSIFSGGFAIAGIDQQFIVVNKSGQETPIRDPALKAVKHFSEDLALVKGQEGKWGYINTTGEFVISPQYSSAGYFSGGLAWARDQNGNIGFIDKEGNWAINPRFSAAKDFDAVSGMALITFNDVKHYVNKEGTLSTFEQTSKLYPFSDGLAIARWNGKIGFINNNMEWVIQPKYTAARAFHNGYATVELNSRWGVIDAEGNVIVEPKFMDVRDVKLIH